MNGMGTCTVPHAQSDSAGVEVPGHEIVKLASEPVRTDLARELRRLGFKFVTLDLEGFRSGSLNEKRTEA